MKKVLKYLTVIILSGTVYIICLILIPRNYDVKGRLRNETLLTWDLSTGSKISYTKVSTTVKATISNPPIIYLHGGPGGKITKGIIEDLQPLADEGFDLYFYDQVGSGYSNRLENIEEYTVERHIADLKEIIDKIGAAEVILMGQSWGAVLLTQFIARYPERVKKAIFTSPAPIFPVRRALADLESPDSLHFKTPRFSNQQGNQKIGNLRSKTTRWYAYSFGKKLMSDEEADNFFTVLNGVLNKSVVCDVSNVLKPTKGSGYYAHIMTMKSLNEVVVDIRGKLKILNIPILVMKGQCDNQSWGFAQEYLKLFSNHELSVIENAGHSIAIEQAEQYIKTLKGFLAKASHQTSEMYN